MKKHAFKKIYLLIFCLLTSGLARAGTAAFVTMDSNGEVTANDPDFVTSINQVVEGVDAFGLADVKASLIVSGASAPSADYGSVIFIPRSFSLEGEWGNSYQKTMMDLLSVFAHEYGHLVFGKILEKEIPEFAKLKQVGDKISALSLQLTAKGLTPAQKQDLQAQIKAAYDLIYKNPELIKISQIVSPYNELFADVVAVFEAGAKSAIADALSYPGMPRNYEDYVMARDFESERDPAKWTQTESHVIFSPLRSVIGSPECWPASLAAKSLRLRQLSAVLVKDIQKKYAAGTQPELGDNQNLIKEFKAYCRRAQ